MFSGKPIDFQPQVISNEGFWPQLDLQDFQADRSIPADIPVQALTDALLSAMAEINGALKARRAHHEAEGFADAQSLPGPSVRLDNGRRINSTQATYRRAVFARAKADLMAEWTSVERMKPDAQPGAGETRDALLTESAFAVRQLMGRPRAGVTLI